jgi:carbonic anhydrase
MHEHRSHHLDCASTTGDIEPTVRADIQALKDSPYVRNDIPVIGYVLDVETSQLREVRYVSCPRDSSVVQSPVMPLVWHATGRSPLRKTRTRARASPS